MKTPSFEKSLKVLLVAESKLSNEQKQRTIDLFAETGICVTFTEKRTNGNFDVVAIIVPRMQKHKTTWYFEQQYGKVIKVTTQNPSRIFAELRTVIKCGENLLI